MIPRYECEEISDIFKDQTKFEYFLKVELALLKALEGDLIPEGTSQLVKQKAKIDINKILEIEKITKHDVIAFCSSITEQLPKEISKYFHYGCTSSDIIDTALSLQIKDALEIICNEVDLLLEALKEKALEHKTTLCMGRSHGMNAEPMSFGQKFLSFYAEIKRRKKELVQFLSEDLTGQLSGAVGNYTVLNSEIEIKALKSLGLKVETLSTQVIPRDHIAKLFSLTALMSCALERMAHEIRHLHHSDISELYEGFSKGQKGSSTMPHKKNPISSENISGLVRVIKSHLNIAHENCILWHERDISHSSAERLILPDNLGLSLYVIRRSKVMIENLVINENIIKEKVFNEYSYLSSYLLHVGINEKDESREDLYEIIQNISFSSTNQEDFIQAIKSQLELKSVDLENFLHHKESFLQKIYLKEVEEIYNRVLN